MSLQDYIAVKEKYAKYLPHSAGRCVGTLLEFFAYFIGTAKTTCIHRFFIVFPQHILLKSVFRIHRIRMFMSLPDPDPLVRGSDPDTLIIKQKK